MNGAPDFFAGTYEDVAVLVQLRDNALRRARNLYNDGIEAMHSSRFSADASEWLYRGYEDAVRRARAYHEGARRIRRELRGRQGRLFG